MSTAACPQCGRPVLPAWRHCAACGHLLSPPPHSDLPYAQQRSLLTPTEHHFFQTLRAVTPPDLQINVKPRLADLISVPDGHANWQAHWNRIQSKHVDFVLCTASSLRPVLVIELDDASHYRPDRRDRDAFVDDALTSAGLPIIHVPTQPSYDADDPARMVEDALRATTARATYFLPAGGWRQGQYTPGPLLPQERPDSMPTQPTSSAGDAARLLTPAPQVPAASPAHPVRPATRPHRLHTSARLSRQERADRGESVGWAIRGAALLGLPAAVLPGLVVGWLGLLALLVMIVGVGSLVLFDLRAGRDWRASLLRAGAGCLLAFFVTFVPVWYVFHGMSTGNLFAVHVPATLPPRP